MWSLFCSVMIAPIVHKCTDSQGILPRCCSAHYAAVAGLSSHVLKPQMVLSCVQGDGNSRESITCVSMVVTRNIWAPKAALDLGPLASFNPAPSPSVLQKHVGYFKSVFMVGSFLLWSSPFLGSPIFMQDVLS